MEIAGWINIILIIFFVCSIIIGGFRLMSEYSDVKTNEEKRAVRNKYIVLSIIWIVLIIVSFSLLNGLYAFLN